MLDKNPEEGDIIPIYLDGVAEETLEGWAKLLKRRRNPLTFIPSESEEDDENEADYKVYSKEKWLIEWIDPYNHPFIKKKLRFDQLITQKTIKGRKYNREVIVYVGRWSKVRKIDEFKNDQNHILTTREEITTLFDSYQGLY